MSSRTVTKTHVDCDAGKVNPNRSCGATVTQIEGGSTRARATAKRLGWTHRHWCGTKIDLCPYHSKTLGVSLPECESKGGRPKK